MDNILTYIIKIINKENIKSYLKKLKLNIEKQKMIEVYHETCNKYFEYGARSSKKVDYFHYEIKKLIEINFTKEKEFSIKMEYYLKSCNSTGKKKCDIVVLYNDKPYIIFPVKIIMTNYKQNKNNSWENLTGEITHLKWANENINIIPINIFMNKTPYLCNTKKIQKFENITLTDIENYDNLKKYQLCFDVINYIIDVEHINKIGESFNSIKIKGFHNDTKYRTFHEILKELI